MIWIVLTGAELTDEELPNIIDQIAGMKLFSTCFCGGESLLRYKILEEGTRRYKSADCFPIPHWASYWRGGDIVSIEWIFELSGSQTVYIDDVCIDG